MLTKPHPPFVVVVVVVVVVLAVALVFVVVENFSALYGVHHLDYQSIMTSKCTSPPETFPRCGKILWSRL